MKPASILIIDDERHIRLMLRTTLESQGYSIEEAADGLEGLDMIRAKRPDLVLLDLNMPHVDGMAVLERLNATSGTRPNVIVLTAFGSIRTAVKATHLGAADFLEKPVSPDELREAVRNVLETPATHSPPVVADVAGRYDAVLERARKSLRMGEFATAEALLMKAADQQDASSADYFNLLGVLYEAQRKWSLARKCYGKAMRADKHHEPARLNMRRIYELYTFGRSKQEVVLGDESNDEPAATPAGLHG